MARSLVVNHTEEPSTSPLFTGFLFLAVAWMFLAQIVGATDPVAEAEAAVPPVVVVP